MFLTQHLTPRWKKEWIPLATQQLRLRNLIQILAFSIENDKKETVRTKSVESGATNESYYFTLHSTIMSAPFYTSEKLKSVSPQWKELQTSSWEGDVCSSVDALVIRLWFNNPQEPEDKVLAVWGVCFSGLIYLGPNLRADIPLKPNSLVFLMQGGYFTDPKCIESAVKLCYASVKVNQHDVRPSYSVNLLTRFQALQHAIKKELAEAEILKKKISMGDFFRSENRGRTTLRRLLSKHKPITHHADLMRAKENIEMAQYRVHILKEEKSILTEKLKELNKQFECLSDLNQLAKYKILENYKLLKREIHNHRDWKRSYIDKREKYLHSKAMLNFRTKQLISELNLIYPIEEIAPEKYTICGVHLPNSEDFAGHDELQISIALGFVTHVIQMIAVFLQIPLRYPVVHFGSRSRIVDPITDRIRDSEREFCLFVKGREKHQFHYAVYLLNKNVAQVRWLCGLSTSDPRNTLENLASLVKMKFGNSSSDQSNRSLSSSTADICGSTVSASSPLDNAASFQTKKRMYHLSESGIDSCSRDGNHFSPHVPGHRVSKSLGSSKDLVMSVFAKKKLHRKQSVTGNLSFSLDKGLNEYEEARDSKEKDGQYGSEPTLTSSVESARSAAKNEFPETWSPGSKRVPFADDESEGRPVDVRPKRQIVLPDARDSEEDARESLPDREERGEGRRPPFGDARDRATAENPERATPDSPAVRDGLRGGLREATNLPDRGEAGRDPESAALAADALLESVTTRTEALASQTTCFNRFRTKFKSALESSN